MSKALGRSFVLRQMEDRDKGFSRSVRTMPVTPACSGSCRRRARSSTAVCPSGRTRCSSGLTRCWARTVWSVAELSLTGEHRRGHGSGCAALARGRVDMTAAYSADRGAATCRRRAGRRGSTVARHHGSAWRSRSGRRRRARAGPRPAARSTKDTRFPGPRPRLRKQGQPGTIMCWCLPRPWVWHRIRCAAGVCLRAKPAGHVHREHQHWRPGVRRSHWSRATTPPDWPTCWPVSRPRCWRGYARTGSRLARPPRTCLARGADPAARAASSSSATRTPGGEPNIVTETTTRLSGAGADPSLGRAAPTPDPPRRRDRPRRRACPTWEGAVMGHGSSV
ncbi:hypothetical protein LX15_005172 [Streptoalloteichus tenebrarius]|uniref:Uncharacterized protein n=1 Tax=Streptoalloteichus tenebrarius (strain ATCC 17920 / DSM 40477 / JCM 4838 / CBS 697.72 / NBRC 16177 / NCIMB 11028 / NRRL B-12390 / A12253. 1 / ISP 5477) TaxID=1933 RepID=A0ABT1I111_STRSD|nr:hypothetical protein [Streptoalloteichus tenebrarius]